MSEIELTPGLLATLRQCYFKRPAQLDRQHTKILVRLELIELVNMQTAAGKWTKLYLQTEKGKRKAGIS